jgi:adenylate cyclase
VNRPQLREATILLADLRGFSAIAAEHPVDLVFDLLNGCFVRMTEIIDRHGGAVDKFMGDAIMAVFSADSAPAEDAKHAVLCAVEMQIAMDEANRGHRKAKRPELYMGIGINTGSVIAGVLGSKLYSAHTVIGEAVNLAARVEAFCLRGQILIGEPTFELCSGFAETGSPVEVYVKGRESGVAMREVLGIPSQGKRVPRQERRRSPRAPVRLPFSYQPLVSDIVSPTRSHGIILDIGYYGVLAEVERELGLHGELRLDFELPLIGYKAADLYGRIVNAKQKAGLHQYGVEFTSIGAETSRNVQAFVQMLIRAAR